MKEQFTVIWQIGINRDVRDKPSKLATSLYSKLITDEIWSLSRQKYGYKKEKPKN